MYVYIVVCVCVFVYWDKTLNIREAGVVAFRAVAGRYDVHIQI
jgi:hypothetical protein